MDLLKNAGDPLNKVAPTQFPRKYRKLFFCRSALFFDKENILKKRSVINGVNYNQIVLPRDKLHLVLKQLHDQSGHLGIDKICKLFQRRFHFQGYLKAIGEYIDSCPNCLIKKSPVKKQTDLGRVTASRPFETLSMDFLKLDESVSGYKKVLVVTDVFTKYAFAFPTKNELALTVAKILVDNVFSIFGIPEKLLSDNGPNFVSDVIKQLCKLLGVKKIYTCPYSPRSDAVCERFNRTLIGMLGTLSERKRSEWHKYIKHLVNVYNSTQHAATNFSPFELVFGRKSRLPVDVFLNTMPEEVSYKNIKEYVISLRDKLETCHSVAKDYSEAQHLENKFRYDQKVTPIKFQVGDKLLVRNSGVKGEHKLEPVWLPEVYVVTEIVGPRVYEVESLINPKKRRVLHLDMLKPLIDLSSKYHKYRNVSHDSFELLKGDELQELFENCESDHATVIDSKSAQSKASSDNSKHVQMPRYNLRSARKFHPQSSVQEDSSDSETYHVEIESEIPYQDEYTEARQVLEEASEEVEFQAEEPPNQQLRSVEESSGDSDSHVESQSTTDEIVAESNVNSGNNSAEPCVQLTDNGSEILEPLDADPLEVSVHGENIVTEDPLDRDPSVSPGECPRRRQLPNRYTRGWPPTRFGEWVNHKVEGQFLRPINSSETVIV